MQQFTSSRLDILKIAKIVNNGGIIAYPTDTVYGLGCDPYNSEAVEKIFQIKVREKKPLPLLCYSLNHACEIAYFDPISIKLAKEFWPGPLTIITPVKNHLLKSLTCNSDFIGLRVPDNDITLSLILECGGYLVGTSANISGYESNHFAPSVISQLKNIDAILIDDLRNKSAESTVVQIKNQNIEILRKGSIDSQSIQNIS